MRKFIIFHKEKYKPNIKERFKTKEFAFSIFLIMCFFGSILLVPLLSKHFMLPVSWILPTIFAIGTYRYFNYLERETEFFVNKDEKYKKELKEKLNEENIVNSAQLDILIKTLAEERDGNQKRLGVALPFVVIGVTLISILSNKVQVTNKELVLYFVIYFLAAFIVHAILKMCEPFFNLYADSVATLVSFLKEIQIEWLDERSAEPLAKNDQKEALENIAEREPNKISDSVEIDHIVVDASEAHASKSSPLN